MNEADTATEPLRTIADIVEQSMCIGCGLCQGIAGANFVRMAINASGYLYPQFFEAPRAEALDAILDACPSMRVNTLPADEISSETNLDSVWGHYRRLVHGWASDPEQRFEGSTGGVLTALGAFLVESGEVDFILHARASRDEPTFGTQQVSYSGNDVLDGVGSRYGPTAILIDIRELLAKGRPFAVIGKPCDISALRNYASHDGRVDELVKYWLTFVCGGFMPPEGTADFLKAQGIAATDLESFRYRGRGFPGPTRAETSDGQVTEVSYLDFWGENYDRWTLPHRCKVCPDSIGESSDIVAADPWPGGGPDLSDQSDPGTNVMIARTERGVSLLSRAEQAGALILSDPATIEQMNDYQPHQVARKYTSWARLQGLKAEDRLVPDTQGLRIADLAQEMGGSFNERQMQGTRRRVRDGKASQPRPESSAAITRRG